MSAKLWKYRVWLPAAYVITAVVVWLDFARSPPDGLANVGLMLVVLPVTLLDIVLRPADAPGSFVLMPDRWGYYGNHAVFYATGVVILAAALTWIGWMIDRRHQGTGR